MTPVYIAFTPQGKALADSLASVLGGDAARCGEPMGLREWTAAHFQTGSSLVFVGAAGIAVRAIAPHLGDKTTDPAVVVVDEGGRFAIPILSGHQGGANDLARAIGRVCGAQPVLTTATDINGVFAVDQWAKRQHCAILDPGRIKTVSGRLLAGGTVRVRSDWPIQGEPPVGVAVTEGEDCNIRLSVHKMEESEALLRLVPRIAVLGVGCKRGTTQDALEAALTALLDRSGLYGQAIRGLATIDRKKDEPGLLAFSKAHGWPLAAYTAEQLRQTAGEFSASAFVERTTGVDNVCERAAVLAAGGPIIQKKEAGGGITMAAALELYRPTWRWRDE